MSRKKKDVALLDGLFTPQPVNNPENHHQPPSKANKRRTRAAINELLTPTTTNQPNTIQREPTPEEQAQEMINRFCRLEEKIGFGLAAVLLEHQMPAVFWLNLTFQQWRKVYQQAPINSPLKERAKAQMRQEADQFWELAFQYNEAQTSEEKQKILTQLAKNAFNFEQYWLVYQRSPASSNTRAIMFGYMETNGTFDNWYQVYCQTKPDQPLYSASIERMLTTAKLEQAAKLYRNAPPGSELQRRVFELMQKQIEEIG